MCYGTVETPWDEFAAGPAPPWPTRGASRLPVQSNSTLWDTIL